MNVAIRDLPPAVGSGTAEHATTEPDVVGVDRDARWFYVVHAFQGITYRVRGSHHEPDAAASLSALIALADSQWGSAADAPDSPDAAERRSQLTRALYASQAESIGNHDTH